MGFRGPVCTAAIRSPDLKEAGGVKRVQVTMQDITDDVPGSDRHRNPLRLVLDEDDLDQRHGSVAVNDI
jgi:hypothetical protein